MQERAANVQALTARPREDRPGEEARSGSPERDREHDPAAHLVRCDQAADGGVDDPDCHERKRNPVRLRCEDLEARVPEGPAAARGTRGHPRCDESEHKCAGVGDHMPGVCEESEGVRDESSRNLRSHDGDDDPVETPHRDPPLVGDWWLVLVAGTW